MREDASSGVAGQHHITVETTVTVTGEVVTQCSCGARWTHPKERSFSERLAINAAHATYGQKLQSTVL